MSDFNWIMSEGGPLICLEAAYAQSWGGIERLTVRKAGATTDYDRACDGLPKWLTSAPLEKGAALFFQGAFDTSFWRRSHDGKIFVVRIEACDIDTNFDIIMNNLNESVFEKPIEVLPFIFDRGDLVVFDSAEEGNEPNKKYIIQKVRPGKYNVVTSVLENDEYSLFLHRFDEQR